MKVVIVDDLIGVVRDMVTVAKEAGHEVLGIRIQSKDYGEDAWFSPDILKTSSLDVATDLIRVFKPDVIFLDHDMDPYQNFDGETFFNKMGLSREKFVGTSSIEQKYCARKMWGNKKFIGESKSNQEEFLMLIEESK